MANTIYSVAERPEGRALIGDIHNLVWAKFMQYSDLANNAYDFMFEHFPQYQLALWEGEKVIAAAHCLPLQWNGDYETLPKGWDASMEQAMRDHTEGRAAQAVTAYAIVVAPDQQGKGLSSVMLRAMCDSARQGGLKAVMACVRPTVKEKYPLTPIERYMVWKREDGEPFDPWIRVHARAGAELVKASPLSMDYTATVAEWEERTGMAFPESGTYIVPGALQPVTIDREADRGHYNDPNIWMVHWVGEKPIGVRG